ncbi:MULTISPECIES: glycosyltransferase [unclassified Dolichospermum]|uniref:glycosyltransferase family 2 protein n=1 Tax=unclassified Dolichospermum TaxID=2622029 RepID=UPI001445B047|nr:MULTISPECIES: glycosyltransferase [unclassified Dolichospermum]MTJ16848.1 glycosyltransferase [Dolichospermum sp. UHCC 0299]MTJ41005.1 glycosyltransferase [Dolichospermum sp. UHCC 0406]
MDIFDCPLVSVVIPAYNAQAFVKEAIDSVLAQSYKNFEVIVIDDGSSDSTLAILDQYKHCHQIKVLTHENNQNLGVSKSRQLGVKHSQGNYIAFLDADDVFLPEKLQIQVNTFSQFEDIVLCHTAVKTKSNVEEYCPDFASNFSISSDVHNYYLNEKSYFLKSNHICNSTTLIKTDVIKKLSFASDQVFQYEDWLLWIMLSDKGKFLFLPQQLIEYRYHPASATNLLLSQPLKILYSRMELFLSVITKIDEKKIRNLVAIELRDTLIDLATNYANSSTSDNNLELVYEFMLDLFDKNSESPNFSQDIGLNIYQKKIYELESQIYTMQNSKIWRLRNKLIFLRKKLFNV